MAGAFTPANAALLSERLGRSPSEGELYIAHFLGAGGAARLISAAGDTPNAGAAKYFPNAAAANTPIFYDRTTGAARSLAQVRDVLTARYDVAARSPRGATTNVAQATGTQTMSPPRMVITIPKSAANSSGAGMASAAPLSPVAAARVAMVTRVSATAATTAPDTAGMTSAFAEAAPKRAQKDGDIFHGLFTDPDRSGPVAEAVSQLWGASGVTPPAASGPMHDLFKDDGQSG
jgi:hypothetical protein